MESLLFILVFVFMVIGLLKYISLTIETAVSTVVTALFCGLVMHYYWDHPASSIVSTITIYLAIAIGIVYGLGFIFLGFLEVTKFARNYIKG
jgi:hypothetical protein